MYMFFFSIIIDDIHQLMILFLCFCAIGFLSVNRCCYRVLLSLPLEERIKRLFLEVCSDSILYICVPLYDIVMLWKLVPANVCGGILIVLVSLCFVNCCAILASCLETLMCVRSMACLLIYISVSYF